MTINNPVDKTLCLVGLLVLKENLHFSKYPPEIQREMAERIEALIERFNTPPPVYDAYGNPYS